MSNTDRSEYVYCDHLGDGTIAVHAIFADIYRVFDERDAEAARDYATKTAASLGCDWGEN